MSEAFSNCPHCPRYFASKLLYSNHLESHKSNQIDSEATTIASQSSQVITSSNRIRQDKETTFTGLSDYMETEDILSSLPQGYNETGCKVESHSDLTQVKSEDGSLNLADRGALIQVTSVQNTEYNKLIKEVEEIRSSLPQRYNEAKFKPEVVESHQINSHLIQVKSEDGSLNLADGEALIQVTSVQSFLECQEQMRNREEILSQTTQNKYETICKPKIFESHQLSSDSRQINSQNIVEDGSLNPVDGVTSSQLTPMQCIKCQKRFKHFKSLSHHTKACVKELKKYNKCSSCSKCFKNLIAFAKHTQHCSEKPESFTCDMCQKSFTSKGAVVRHIKRVHEKQRSHQCKICHRRFFILFGLEQHMNEVHRKLRPFKCNLCDKSFARIHLLDGHTNRIHDNPKPFNCNICNIRRFNKLEDFVKHSKFCSKKCDLCQGRMLSNLFFLIAVIINCEQIFNQDFRHLLSLYLQTGLEPIL